MKESKPVTSDDRIILSADKKTLTIVKVVKEDAGSYKCQLKNKVNKDESTYVMVINCKYPREERSIEYCLCELFFTMTAHTHIINLRRGFT